VGPAPMAAMAVGPLAGIHVDTLADCALCQPGSEPALDL